MIEIDSQTWLLVLFLVWGIVTNILGVYLAGIRFQPKPYGTDRAIICFVLAIVWMVALLWVLGVF